MSTEIVASENVEYLRKLKGKPRDIAMFGFWYEGLVCEKVAELFDVSRGTVERIKKRDKWHKLADELKDRAYRALGLKLKGIGARLITALDKDLNLMLRKLDKGDQLDKDERAHMRSVLEGVLKEVRLIDNKPTEISANNGEVIHRIILPPGVKRFGVIPADSKVIPVEHQDVPEAQPDESRVSVEDILGEE